MLGFTQTLCEMWVGVEIPGDALTTTILLQKILHSKSFKATEYKQEFVVIEIKEVFCYHSCIKVMFYFTSFLKSL